jgi:hypothetical protein
VSTKRPRKSNEPVQVHVSTTDCIKDEAKQFYLGWQPSSEATGKDEQESKRVKRIIRAQPKRCWFNARRAVLRLAEYSDASYIEGWVMLKTGTVAEHGWLVKDGIIIDPTLPTQVAHYFPGLEFKGRNGIEDFLATPLGRKHRHDPFHYAFGWGGEYSPSYIRAFEQARAIQTQHGIKASERNKAQQSGFMQNDGIQEPADNSSRS